MHRGKPFGATSSRGGGMAGRGGYHSTTDKFLKFSGEKLETPCSYFLTGNCKYGDSCTFGHFYTKDHDITKF